MKITISSVALAISAALALSACNPNTTQVDSIEAHDDADKQQVEQPLSAGIVTEYMDTTVDPGDDFYQYANGAFLDSFEIPADKASYGVFIKLRDEAQENVIAIIKESAEGDFPHGSDEQKVGDMYTSYMDMETRNALGLSPVEPILNDIAAINNHDELMQYFAKVNKYQITTPFSFFQYADFKSPNDYGLYVFQSGLGLPDREYYFKEGETSQTIREKYLAHIEKVFTLAGIDQPAQKANTVYAIEEQIANLHMKKEQTRNWAENYQALSLDELSTLMPKVDMKLYLQSTGYNLPEKLIIMQQDYLTGIGDIIVDTPIADWQAYLQWSTLKSAATILTAELDQANFDFYRKTLAGVEEQQPMWRRATQILDRTLGEVIGKVYVKRHFPPAAKERMAELVDNLLAAYEDSIKNLDWMTDETRAQALDKLSKFTVKIGYPDKWKDYSKLTVDSKTLYANLVQAADVFHAKELAKQGKPVDKTEWGMTPQTVNAYYMPTSNEIVFPAAILQPPFFNMQAEDAVNYGGIGAVIGHEIGHGFDDAGSTFDGDGKLRNWWTEADLTEFKQRTGALVEQYNQFEALPDVFVNGEFTLGENIGDLGGVSIGLKAYKMSLNGAPAPVIDGFTGEQRLFLGYAQVWAGKYRDEALRSKIDTDPHSPGKFRANGAVRNVPEWYSAFDVTPEDALYLAPEERVKIW